MRNAKLWVAVLVGVVGGEAGAYTLSGPKWPRSSLPVPYEVDVASSRELGAATTRQVVQASFQSWADPSCSAFRSTYARDITGGRASPNDRRNVLVWLYSSWPAELGGSSTIGVTTPVWFEGSGGGQIVDADIQFNGVHHSWTTNPRAFGEVDAQSIITHEAGHFLGLGHSRQIDATMYGAYQGGTSARTLSSDDIAGVCVLYPSGPGNECSSTRPCPNGGRCENGYCIATGGGGGTLGEPCTEGCASGHYCVCTDQAQTNCFCTRDCSASSPCPTTWQCAPLEGGGGACVPDSATGDGRLGDRCTDGSQCANGFCVGVTLTDGICSQPCSTSQPCPSGYDCAPLQGGGGACVPHEDPGPASDGGPPPPPSDAGTPRPPQGLGATCSSYTECESRLCSYLTETTRICTRSCSQNNPCPQGFTCGRLATGSLGCIPDTPPPSVDGGTDPEPPPEQSDGGRVIRPRDPQASGGCASVPGAATGAVVWLLLGAGALAGWRRRPR